MHELRARIPRDHLELREIAPIHAADWSRLKVLLAVVLENGSGPCDRVRRFARQAIRLRPIMVM